MAGTDRSASYALSLRLLERPYSFDFFQAIRRIEAANPLMPRIGAAARLRDEPVRFGQIPSLAFAPSTLHSFVTRAGTPDRLNVNFMGLLGPNGPLPLHLTEYAFQRLHHARDATFTRFLDIFHHRAIALFYRAWAVNQPTVSFDRALYDPGADRFGYYVSCLTGRGTDRLRDADSLPEDAKRHFAGRLSSQPRSPEGLEAMVADYFGVPCELQEFVGRWVELAPESVWRLGATAPPGTEPPGMLGRTTVAGRRIWSFTHGFRLRIGPVGMAKYARFLPQTPTFARLAAWVRNAVGFEHEWDAQIVLRREEVPGTVLGSKGPGVPSMLGWTTWIRSSATEPMDRDRGDLVLHPRDEGPAPA